MVSFALRPAPPATPSNADAGTRMRTMKAAATDSAFLYSSDHLQSCTVGHHRSSSTRSRPGILIEFARLISEPQPVALTNHLRLAAEAYGRVYTPSPVTITPVTAIGGHPPLPVHRCDRRLRFELECRPRRGTLGLATVTEPEFWRFLRLVPSAATMPFCGSPVPPLLTEATRYRGCP